MTDDVDVAALTRWIRRVRAARRREHRTCSPTLDSAIGDADHGTNMDRGMAAVTAALADDTTGRRRGAVQAGRDDAGQHGRRGERPALRHRFLRMAAAVGDARPLDPPTFAEALRAGLDGVVARGKAEAGDKTMYDALAPAVDALDAALAAGVVSGRRPAAAAVAAAEAGRDATTPMLARKGRASYLGERSVGHQDPGATSVTPAARRRPPANSAAGRSPGTDRDRPRRRSHSRALARAAVGLAPRDDARPRRHGSRSPRASTTPPSVRTRRRSSRDHRGEQPGRRRRPDGPRQCRTLRRTRPGPAR